MNLVAHITDQAAAGDRKPRFSASEEGRIAIVEMRGTLTKFGSSLSTAGSTVEARRQIREAARAPEVDGILLVIDSPGGLVDGTADLADSIHEAAKAKPVYAQVEDLAASAAFWVASQATKVFVNQPHAKVGSIGTFTVLYDLSELAEREGIKAVVIKSGDMKGAGVPGTPITDDMKEHIQGLVNDTQAQFDKAIARGRRMKIDAVRAVADGRVFTAGEAQRLGLIDGVQALEKTMSSLRREAKSISRGKATAQLEGGSMSIDDSRASETTVTAPKAVTIKELRAGCPGADEKFLVAQIEREATLPQAQHAWMEEQSKRLAAAEKAQAEAEAKAKAKEEADAKRPGVDPVSESGSGKGDDNTDALARWNEAVAAKEAQLKDRGKAIRAVVREDPDLHAAYIAAANEGRGRRRSA